MARRFPPFSALRAFEAAARHLSFSRAADELNLTHGAASRSIRQLEEFLGEILFIRHTRAVSLTSHGRTYAEDIREVFERLAAANDRVRAHKQSGPVNVSTLDSFVAKWLLPRMPEFRRAHPDIDIRLSTADEVIDLIGGDFDMAIRYGAGQYSGLQSDLLLKEDVTPICSPQLLEGERALRAPEDLKHHTLIHDVFEVNWMMWLTAAGVEGVDSRSGPCFESSDLVIQAAIQGEGVALGRSALVGADLAAGRLVQPFDLTLTADFAYYIVYPPAAMARQSVRAFRDWLLGEALTHGRSLT